MPDISTINGVQPVLRQQLGNRAFTTTTTPASGSCAVQFVFSLADGTPLAAPLSGSFYLCSDAAGLTPVQPDTSIAVLTNGALSSSGSTALRGPHYRYVTTAAGLLGMTVTAVAGTFYIAFVQPNGDVSVSAAIVSQ